MPNQSPSGPSRRRFLRQTTFTAISIALSACASPVAFASSDPIPPPHQGLASLHNTPIPPLTAPIRPQLLPDVPLAVKIGQMLLLGFRGAVIDDSSVIAKNIRDQHLGSVVLFGANVRSPKQLKQMTGDLQSLAQLPLLISVDQEGGQVARLTERLGFTSMPSAAQLGRSNTPEETRDQSAAMAQVLADVGITLNLAPVVDVAVNPRNPIIARLERSFSADPEVVATQAGAFIDGHHDRGVKCTLKHFPGHGSSLGDTHQGFVNVSDTWSVAELIPYLRLIGQGKADAVMTAHIFDSALDPDLPATLSPSVVTGLLREKLGYDGVVVSDDMQMRAITDLFPLDEAFELAILAGVDVISVSKEVTYAGSVADQFIGTVHRMLEGGTITEERIDQSFRRIMRLKGLASL